MRFWISNKKVPVDDNRRQKRIDEYMKLWAALGGADRVVTLSTEDLAELALQHGADERQIEMLLQAQMTFKEIEEDVQIERRDSIYAAEVESESATFEKWVEETRKHNEKNN
ncbi:hypothetical protein R5H32_16170 [Defluviimonas sp. D31]|uniref:hypothetical protein n=1 Tax=Defluviimonas sp. D31 TaxID=3083253 RepID=UPI00296E2E08|nr:hypothetical protein [Defluviimonas sp. D31]MDW4550898.1 hypothetical protein [Defluviimonas sp. D31]